MTHVGVRFDVTLAGTLRWTGFTSSDPGIAQVLTVATPDTGGLTATVRALRKGTTTLAASGGAVCRPGQPCPAFIVSWRLAVTVT